MTLSAAGSEAVTEAILPPLSRRFARPLPMWVTSVPPFIRRDT
jgi:hypothetical protein